MVTSNINYLVQQSQFCHYPANPQGCHSWGGAGSHAKCSQSTSHSSPAPKCSEADLPKCIGGKKSPLLSFRELGGYGEEILPLNNRFLYFSEPPATAGEGQAQ